MADREPTDYDEARADLTRGLETKLRYDYTYIEYLTATFLNCFSCCYKKRQCYKRKQKRL